MKYYVTVKIEETIEIDYTLSESEAIKLALQSFDPSAHDTEVVEAWIGQDD